MEPSVEVIAENLTQKDREKKWLKTLFISTVSIVALIEILDWMGVPLNNPGGSLLENILGAFLLGIIGGGVVTFIMHSTGTYQAYLRQQEEAVWAGASKTKRLKYAGLLILSGSGIIALRLIQENGGFLGDTAIVVNNVLNLGLWAFGIGLAVKGIRRVFCTIQSGRLP